MRLDVKRNTISGAVSGIANKIIASLCPFVLRTIMIYYMGTEYLGLSSLFTSILSMLSLAELGFGGALVYSMYKPIAENDTKSICALMKLYKKVYMVIGTIILTVGIIIMPFVPKMINGSIPDEINIYILYLIYLINTVASYYFFAYKNSLLAAFQRNDVSNNINTIITIVQYSLQIVLILMFRNYYYYAVVFPVCTIGGNLIRAIIVDKLYPQYISSGEVPLKEKHQIYKRTFGLACHKVGNTISTSLDSMIISSFLGLSSVAIYGNYNYIVTTLMAFIWIIYYSMTAGIGNRMNLISVKENYIEFKTLTTFNNILNGWSTGCVLFLVQPFIKLWAGKNNLLPASSALIFSLYYYVFQSRKIVLLYKDAAGLWKEDQFKPIIGAAFNLIINLALVRKIGIDGVIISSILSFLVIEIPWESCALYKYYFQRKSMIYFIGQIKDFIVMIPCWIIEGIICSHIVMDTSFVLILRGIVCVCLPIPYIFFIYRNDKELKAFMIKIFRKVNN